ncbi:ATP-dependent DNA helicase [Pluteus cervinus]|uniref:ATP-dependent DNA helicase n=1 Tax=Pluteus cervinus TaxID=181527 RepID=A0ACD3AY42_9AGAR|nr:ATP-dependent DNA helicase [Pluteus cervinus]
MDQYGAADYLGSDDFDAYMRTGNQQAGTSRSTPAQSEATLVEGSSTFEIRRATLQSQKESYERRIQELKEKIAQVDAELDALEEDPDQGPTTDFTTSNFTWTANFKRTMRSVFGIERFRFCQQGVCNANMSGRDIVCVMPTGGGKSLTYQLPAILQEGVTLVISPLISLITDQVIHLEEAGVQAIRLTSANTPAENLKGMNRLSALADSTSGSREDDIKLVYVTPEKVVKSPNLKSVLQRLADRNKLERIVIDEAHCVSQMGHDFRPDYAQLHILRQLYPHVPIMAVSATCPPKVLQDLLSILRLRKPVDGDRAPRTGTVYFKSPLYRKNLHYTILPKPASGKELLQSICNFITTKHPNDSGIIYCLSRKDAEEVAAKLQEMSCGIIKTGVYHAERKAWEKEGLHRSWREGKIKVVCATIAFGLGIDKGDVRFVIHHTMSKSVDGFYQESGRAGRDGKDAECILYFQPADFTDLCSLVQRDKEGVGKVMAMLKFAQNLDECRKVQFACYFQHASAVDISQWATDNEDALSRCGHCDNCKRKDGVLKQEITLQVWQLLQIVEAVERSGLQVTFRKLASFATGHKVQFSTNSRRGSERVTGLNLTTICDGRVRGSSSDVEYILGHLLIKEYLVLAFKQTAYQTNVYIRLGEKGRTYTILDQGGVQKQAHLKMYLTLLLPATPSPSLSNTKRKAKAIPSKPSKKARVAADNDSADADEDVEMEGPSHHTRSGETSTKGKGKARMEPEVEPESDDEIEILSSRLVTPPGAVSSHTTRCKAELTSRDEWSFSMRDKDSSDDEDEDEEEDMVRRPSRRITRKAPSSFVADNVLIISSSDEE